MEENYGFNPSDRTENRYVIPFTVAESKNPFPKTNLGAGSWMNEPQYRKLQAISLAATLQILGKGFFGGRGGHVVYPFEYSYEHPDEKLDSEIINDINESSPRGETVKLLEIGGQQGKHLATIIARAAPPVKATILDLDLTRRDLDSYPDISALPSGKELKYIQGDAQRFAENCKIWGIPESDIILVSNLLHVAFDSFGILAQAWDNLKPGGSLIMSQLGLYINVPLWLDTDNTKLAAELAHTFGMAPGGIYRSYEDLKKWKAEWHDQHAKFLRSLPKNEFIFDSQKDNESRMIKRFLAEYDELPDSYPQFDLGKILQKMGYEVKMQNATYENSQYQSVIRVKKRTNDNPFDRFMILGMGKTISMDNITIPQIYRSIALN